jgi:hypothetical protein
MENETKVGKKIYFGTGLASTKSPSVGLGLGTLGMILTAAVEGKTFDTNQILHEIGSGYNLSSDEQKRLANEQMVNFNKIRDNIKKLTMRDGRKIELSHVLMHENMEKPEFAAMLADVKKRLEKLDAIPNYAHYKDYTEKQTAEVKMAFDRGAVMKIGWTPKGTTHDLERTPLADLITGGKINEYYFDEVMRTCYPDIKFGTKYVAGDIDFETGMRKSPYTVTAGETRPLVDTPIHKFMGKIPTAKKKTEALANISKYVVAPFEELYGEISTKSTDANEKTVNKVAEIQTHLGF